MFQASGLKQCLNNFVFGWAPSHPYTFKNIRSLNGPVHIKAKLSVFMSKQKKNIFFKKPNPKNSPMGPQKPKTNTKIWSKLKVRIEGSTENENCSAIQKNSQKTFLNLTSNPEITHWGKKSQK